MVETHIYTDGSCANNGSSNARAGYAVYFGQDDRRNEYKQVDGKQTNNTGELTGFIRAIELSMDVINAKHLVHIHTDSEYVIKCVSTYGKKLAENNWRTSKDKIPPNCELVKKAYTLYQQNKGYIKIHHVKAHTTNDDEHSVGNREADRLANLAIGVYIEDKPVKHYLNISYAQKDTAKELGARWDMNAKKWYYMDDLDDENKIALQSLREETTSSIPQAVDILHKHYVKIAFKDKNQAKNLGARWDAACKSWYYTNALKQENIDKLISLSN